MEKNPKEIVAAHHQEEFYNTNWETTTFIYTDASYMEDSKGVGVSVVATDQRDTIMEKLAINTGDGNLVYNGELGGITQGIEYASLQARPGHSFRIFSDNKAALHRLAKLLDLPRQGCQIRAIAAAKKIKEKDAKISISWIPGHSQIRGNVKAEILAKKASKLEPLNNETSFAFIKFQIAKMRKEKWIKYLRKNYDNPRLSRIIKRQSTCLFWIDAQSCVSENFFSQPQEDSVVVDISSLDEDDILSSEDDLGLEDDVSPTFELDETNVVVQIDEATKLFGDLADLIRHQRSIDATRIFEKLGKTRPEMEGVSYGTSHAERTAADIFKNLCNYGEEWDCRTWNSSIPRGQLILLAAISLVEQTALNSMSPYLPEMVTSFPGVESQDRGIAVGTLGSVFAFAQFSTNLFWGWLSDKIGRKPVMMIGTISTAACFVAFGFCRNLWQAIFIQVLMGLVNGNQGIISSCLGEITNKSNQSRVFVYLPVVFGIGAITGPALGGLMIFQRNPFKKEQKNPFPFLVPNIISAIILTITFVLMACFLEETLVKSDESATMRKTVAVIFRQQFQFFNRFYASFRHRFSNRSDLLIDFDEESTESIDRYENRSILSESVMNNIHENEINAKSQTGHMIFCRDTLILLGTYLVFQLSNVSFNSLYPIFLSEKEPIGRNLSVEAIGLSLSLSGVIAIIFQGILLEKLKQKIGNKATYRAGLFLFFISMIAMPWINYSHSPPLFGWGNGRLWLWVELGFLLFLKTVASVGGFTSALLLVVLGTLNGLAQTLSAAGRAIGPILSGSLFSTAAAKFHTRGEVLPWTVFGGIAFLSFLASFGIKSSDLESESWDEQISQNEDEQFY
ncbi:unnamed protein product [Trifolium pratense]|uniref:Uncharacterized protein n=1 Tax=Trifolium pratense TaxID=57577 RepID=A0ACB0JL95_TRIPR|nr:unnamed protein product [Trifolium pratense]